MPLPSYNTVVMSEITTSDQLSGVCTWVETITVFFSKRHGNLVDSLRFFFFFKGNSFMSIKASFLWVRAQKPDLRRCRSTPTSQALRIPSKQWPSSHYVPRSRPLAGPFPRRFTNPTAHPRTSPLTVINQMFLDTQWRSMKKGVLILAKAKKKQRCVSIHARTDDKTTALH